MTQELETSQKKLRSEQYFLTLPAIMVSYFEASLNIVSVHHVGNQLQNELYALSERPLAFKDEVIPQLLLQYFLKPFEKSNEVYHLMHSGGDGNGMCRSAIPMAMHLPRRLKTCLPRSGRNTF